MHRTLTAVCVTVLFAASATAADTARKDPLTTFQFALKIANVGANGEAFFKSVSGLTSETEVVDYQEGGANGGTQKIAGKSRFGNVTLTRPVSDDISLATWRKLVEDGALQAARRTGTLVLYDKPNHEIAHWTIVNVWPSKLSIEMDPDTGDPVEVITLAVEAIRR